MNQPSDQLRPLVPLLRRYRLEENMSYRRLARLVGVPHSRLFEVMNATQPRVNDRTLFRLEAFIERIGLIEKVSA